MQSEKVMSSAILEPLNSMQATTCPTQGLPHLHRRVIIHRHLGFVLKFSRTCLCRTCGMHQVKLLVMEGSGDMLQSPKLRELGYTSNRLYCCMTHSWLVNSPKNERGKQRSGMIMVRNWSIFHTNYDMNSFHAKNLDEKKGILKNVQIALLWHLTQSTQSSQVTLKSILLQKLDAKTPQIHIHQYKQK